VSEAEDGEEAISKAESIQPDIILMDTSLPRVDGLTATLRIRTLETLRAVPIIFLSGHAQEQARHAALATGATEYLIKPVLPHELESAVERHLRSGLQWEKGEESSEGTV
jgi:CheY-like chemotaxis protein